jgi:hypothetical protein
MHKFLVCVAAALLLTSQAKAQQVETPYANPDNQNIPHWVQLMYGTNPDPGKVTTEYSAYYKSHQFVKNKHTQYYKRWMRSFSRQDYKYPVGSPEYNKRVQNQANYLQNSQAKGGQTVWTGIGPFDFDKDAASRSYAPGAAHVYGVEQSISNPNILYIGTATTGLWKTTNKGLSWTCLTKDMMVDYIFSVEINRTNPDIVLFGGAGKVYKTTNGGTNWVVTGDATFNADNHDVRDIVTDPTNANIIFLTSDNGYYRSTDAGNNWTQIFAGDFQEIELHPTNHNTVYLIEQTGNKTLFRKSIDNGLSFTAITNGWPNPVSPAEQKRTEIATTPAAPNNVYALCTGEANGGSGLYGVYVSTDQGASWTFRCCGTGPGGVPAPDNINMMGWDDQGQDDGGQYYYDLALDVSDSDPNRINVGGVNPWISTDGGFTFTCPAKWSNPEKPAYVHADIHDIRYFGNDLWVASDGGLFYSTSGGDTANRRQTGIEGTDFWGFGATAGTGKVMLGGTYHNGTLLKDNNTYQNGWLSCMGGDNVRGFVNFANDRKVYHDYGKSVLSGNRNVPLVNGSFPVQPNMTYIIGESSNYEFHPHSQNIIYYGSDNILYKSDGEGAGATPIHDFGEKVTSVEIAPTNPDVIYVCTYPGWWDDKHVFKTTDGGQNWTNITPSTGTINGEPWVPYDITVSSTDANTVWLARTSQYGDYPSQLEGYRIFKSTNGGSSWVNYTGTTALDGESVTHIEHQRGTDGGVWIGTRRAVYYRNNSMADWQLYNSGLPATTFSVQLFINYRQGLIWNATNRSIHEAPLIEQNPPLAQIAADKFTVDCFDNVVHFADNSAMSSQNASWQWTFPGGSPANSTLQNPIVTYSAPGSYNVTLTVTDAFGTDTQTLTAFINFNSAADTVDLAQDFEPANYPANNWRLLNSNQTFDWTLVDVDAGPLCTAGKAMRAENYYIERPGDEAYLISPRVSLAGIINPSLSYYYAYTGYDGYSDSLRVEISNNCGASWNTLFFEGGDGLLSTTQSNDYFAPTNCNQWLQKLHNLDNYIGDTVMFRFVCVNDYGNNLFLDNINITGQPSSVDSKPVELTSIFPNPSAGDFFINTNEKDIKLTVFSATGQQVYSNRYAQGTHKFNLDVAAGMYFARIETPKGSEVIKLVVR